MTDVAEMNCACESVSPWRTLAEIRFDMLVGMGYAAQAANPPVGTAALVRYHLQRAQNFLWKQYTQMQCERFFKWTMVPGLRYYGFDESDEGNTETGVCTKKLDPLTVKWVGFEDLNQSWQPLIKGIPPEFYTRANDVVGWPAYYDIRSCIEIFPAPQAAYSLWVKGNFGIGPLIADSDRTTIDDEAVLLFALARWKKANGKLDADDAMSMALQYVGGIVAGTHATRRYVPNPHGPWVAMTPPKFLPLSVP